MRITDLQVDGFGIWSNLHLGDLSDRLTVVFGPNEAGKTTLMQFLRAMFYGVSADRRRRYLPPVQSARAGGTLLLDTNHGALTIQRTWTGESSGPGAQRGQLTVEDAEGNPRPAGILSQLLAGIDEPTFNNVFSVGLRELQELGTLDDTDAADLLYKLTTGLDRVSLVDVMRELESSRDQLFDCHDGAGQIAELTERREQLQRQVKQLATSGQQWLELRKKTAALDGQLQDCQAQITQLRDQLQIVELATRVRPLWLRRRELDAEIKGLGPVPTVPDDAITRLAELRDLIAQRRETLDEIRGQRREIRREADAQPINRQLWSNAARIEALAEHVSWIASLQAQIIQLRADIQVIESRAGAPSRQERLEEDDALELANLPEVSKRTIALLRAPARAMREAAERLKQAREEHLHSEQQLEEMTVELETVLLDQGYDHLPDAVERAGELANRIRRRLGVEQRLDELFPRRKQLQEDRFDLLDKQVLSLSALAWLGVPFVVGVMLILGGMVWQSAAMLGWPVALLGLAGWAVGVVAKVSMEKTAERDLQDCESHLEVLASQIEKLEHERDALDAELPRGGGPLETRLAKAEDELAQLEQLVPLESNTRTTAQRREAARRRVEQLEAAVKETRSEWRVALRHAGLPENATPQTVRRLAEGSRNTLQLRRQLAARREELAARERELTALSIRIEELVEQVQLTVRTDDPQLQLKQLVAALAEQQRLYQRRDVLRQEDRKLRLQGRDLAVQLRKLQHERRAIVAAAGVLNEKQLHQLISRHARRCQLTMKHDKVVVQLQAAIGQNERMKAVQRELKQRSAIELEGQQTELSEQIQALDSSRTDLLQRRGAWVQQRKALTSDKRLAEARFKLAEIDQQLRLAVDRWTVVATAGHVLETVRDTYETHRQPQTLIDASRYFERLTEGRYLRIWTPLTENALRVDSTDGNSLSVDLLSSGTREAVFLSLRLALVSDFARRGIRLPLILDDVLVNFDLQRAQAAANVLNQFADDGCQVLLFTCHDHIMQMFQKSSATIRYLVEHEPDQRLVLEDEQPEEELVPAMSESKPPTPEPYLIEEVTDQGGDDEYELGPEEERISAGYELDDIEYESEEDVDEEEEDEELELEQLEDEEEELPAQEEERLELETEEEDEDELEAETLLQSPPEPYHRPPEPARYENLDDTDHRFTWESPERYQRGDAAA